MWFTITALIGLAGTRSGRLGTLALLYLLLTGGIMGLVIIGLVTSR